MNITQTSLYENVLFIIIVRYGAESCLSKYVFPLPAKGDDEVAWTEQLLVTMRHLDTPRINALIKLTNISIGLVKLVVSCVRFTEIESILLSSLAPMERYVEACIAYNVSFYIDRQVQELIISRSG